MFLLPRILINILVSSSQNRAERRPRLASCLRLLARKTEMILIFLSIVSLASCYKEASETLELTNRFDWRRFVV